MFPEHLRTTTRPLHLFVLLSFAAACGAADVPTEVLEEVVVTATRSKTDKRKVSQSVNVVEQKRVQDLQATTPALMLQDQPGIWVNQVSAQGSPIIRGQIGNRVLYLWDGVRINNGGIFSGPNPFFNQFPVDAVGRMEVVRGSGSVQYGSDAIGGVINVLSKRGEFSESLNIGGDIYSRYGSNNSEFTSAANVHMANNTWAFAAGWTIQDVGDYRSPTYGVQAPTGFHASGGYANLAFRPADGHTFRLSWIGNERTRVGSYVQSKLNANNEPRIYSPLERRGIVKLDYTGENLGLLSDELKIYGYYQYYDQVRERRVQTAPQFANTTTDTNQDIWGVGIQNASSHGPVSFLYGVDYRHENLQSSQWQDTLVYATGLTTRTQPAGSTPDGTYDVLSSFISTEYRPWERLVLNGGLRYERTHLHSTPEPMDVIPAAGYTVADLVANKRWNAVTWNIGGVFQATKKWDLVANVGSGYRAPTFSDLLSAGTPVFSSLTASLPSTSIDPERSITYEVGTRYHGERLQSSLTAYYTQLKDLIVQQNSGTVVIGGVTYNATRRTNAANGYVTGAEFSLSYQLAKNLTFFNNTTYTYGQNQTQGVPLRFVPPMFGTFGLRYESNDRRWWVEVAEAWAAQLNRHNPDDEIDAGFSYDPAYGSPGGANPRADQQFEIPSFFVTNIRAGVKVWEHGATALSLTLNLNNVFNASYSEAYSQQQREAAGFNAVVGARLTF